MNQITFSLPFSHSLFSYVIFTTFSFITYSMPTVHSTDVNFSKCLSDMACLQLSFRLNRILEVKSNMWMVKCFVATETLLWWCSRWDTTLLHKYDILLALITHQVHAYTFPIGIIGVKLPREIYSAPEQVVAAQIERHSFRPSRKPQNLPNDLCRRHLPVIFLSPILLQFPRGARFGSELLSSKSCNSYDLCQVKFIFSSARGITAKARRCFPVCHHCWTWCETQQTIRVIPPH